MTILRDFYPKVRAIQIGKDLDAACGAINEQRNGASEYHVWNNRKDFFIARKDGSFETAGTGDWLVSAASPGGVFPSRLRPRPRRALPPAWPASPNRLRARR
jgi:hypothetical protein